MKWFKFYGADYLIDPKILSLSPAERSCWITLLCYANNSDNNGEINYLSEKQLLIQAGLNQEKEEWEETKGILNKFQDLGLIMLSDNGVITLKNWIKRQETNLTGYERVKRWRVKNKEKTLTHNRNRRALVRGSEGSFTLDEWLKLKKKYFYKCLICGKQEPKIVLTTDHIIPLSKGGTNFIGNIQPLCGKCNSSKKDIIYDNVMITSEKKRVDKIREEENDSFSSNSKKKPYFKNEEMRWSKSKWWILPADGGEWLEFAGKDSEIKWK